MTSPLDKLRRTNRNLAAVLRRERSGQLTGRNSRATDQTVAWHIRGGRQLVHEIEAKAPLLLVYTVDEREEVPDFADFPRLARWEPHSYEARPIDRFNALEKEALNR